MEATFARVTESYVEAIFCKKDKFKIESQFIERLRNDRTMLVDFFAVNIQDDVSPTSGIGIVQMDSANMYPHSR